MKAINDNVFHCDSHWSCWGNGTHRLQGREKMQCSQYREGWSGTKLAITGREDLRQRPSALVDQVYKRCHALRNFTDSEKLQQYLEEEYWHIPTGGERRTVSGLIVRILTDFIDYSLCQLTRDLDLSPGKGFYLVRSPLLRAN